MRSLPLLLFLVPACDSPSPGLWTAEPVRASVARFAFSVRVDGDRAESIRLNPMWPPPRSDHVVAAAGVAMRAAGGCDLKPGSLRGDAAVQLARLDCGASGPPALVLHPEVWCDVDVAGLTVDPTGEVYGVACEVDLVSRVS